MREERPRRMSQRVKRTEAQERVTCSRDAKDGRRGKDQALMSRYTMRRTSERGHGGRALAEGFTAGNEDHICTRLAGEEDNEPWGRDTDGSCSDSGTNENLCWLIPERLVTRTM